MKFEHAIEDSERAVIADLLLQPELLGDVVAAGLAPSHFATKALGTIFAAMLSLDEERIEITVESVTAGLEKARTLASVGGPIAIAELIDERCSLATAWHAARVANEGRRRVIASTAQRLADDPDDAAARERLLRALEDRPADADAAKRAQIQLGRDVLEALAKTPEPEWLVPSLLRPGKATVIGGTTITGKSMAAVQIGSAIAGGIPPWPGMEARESGPVVFLGYDPHMSVEDVARRLRHLDDGAHRRGIVPPWSWADAFAIVGHSERTGPFPVDRYRLDAEGVERIAKEILRPLEQQLGRLAMVIVDTLSTAFPEGTEENDSAAMNAVMTRLSMLGVEFGAAILAAHHPTKAASAAGEKFDSWSPLAYFRGSGAIPSAAGVLAGLWAPPAHPRHRVLTCWSNSGPRRRWWFEVADPERAAHGWIDYFLAVDPPDSADGDSEMMLERLGRAFAEIGDALTEYQVAKKLCGKPEATGAAKRAAAELVAWSLKRRMLELHDGSLRLTADGRRALIRAREGVQ